MPDRVFQYATLFLILCSAFYDVGEIVLTDSHTMALRRFFILGWCFFWFYAVTTYGVTTWINKVI